MGGDDLRSLLSEEGGSSCGRLWCCSCRCCVVLFLSCVCVCDLFLCLHPAAGCCSCRVVCV